MLVVLLILSLILGLVLAIGIRRALPIRWSKIRFHSVSVQPRQLALCFHHVKYKDDEHNFEIATCSLALTKYARILVTLDNFALQVYASSSTPPWVQSVRRNVISAVLSTDHERILSEDFHSNVTFVNDLNAEKNEEEEEVRLTVRLGNWIRKSTRARLYTLNVTGQLRTNCDDHQPGEGGKLVVLAENCSWVQCEPSRKSGELLDFMDLCITRADITFDHFRIRDAELPRQLIQRFESWRRQDVFDGFYRSFFGFEQDA